MELMKLAYLAFEEKIRKTITKDHYIKGIHPKMQMALKSLLTFCGRGLILWQYLYDQNLNCSSDKVTPLQMQPLMNLV